MEPVTLTILYILVIARLLSVFISAANSFPVPAYLAIRHVWNVKLITAPQHVINKSPLFKYIKHPNYSLNMVPEERILDHFIKSILWK